MATVGVAASGATASFRYPGRLRTSDRAALECIIFLARCVHPVGEAVAAACAHQVGEVAYVCCGGGQFRAACQHGREVGLVVRAEAGRVG